MLFETFRLTRWNVLSYFDLVQSDLHLIQFDINLVHVNIGLVEDEFCWIWGQKGIVETVEIFCYRFFPELPQTENLKTNCVTSIWLNIYDSRFREKHYAVSEIPQSF